MYDNLARVGPLTHGQEGTRAVVDAAPAELNALPLLGDVGDHAAAPNPGIVEQQVDSVGIVAIRHLVTEALDLHCVGHVGHMRRDPQALRQSRGLTEPVRLHHPRLRNVAYRDVTSFRNQLAHEFPSHSRAAAGNDSSPAREIFDGRNLS